MKIFMAVFIVYALFVAISLSFACSFDTDCTLEVSVLKGQGQFTEFVPAVFFQGMPMTKNQSMILLIRTELLEIRAVLTRIVGQVTNALNPAEVFTERVLDNVHNRTEIHLTYIIADR